MWIWSFTWIWLVYVDMVIYVDMVSLLGYGHLRGCGQFTHIWSVCSVFANICEVLIQELVDLQNFKLNIQLLVHK